MRMSGESEVNEGTFEVHGDQVTIHGPDGDPLVFTRKGDSLIGSFDSLTLEFKRK